ncbi:hypothetical protein CVS40_9099 [Lucilia cuprina]|nr:hypothetical protein CVS40_9099 [Lucilia cuprina]
MTWFLFQIEGSGLIARLLRKTMGNFNMHETVSTYLTNEACLPSPTCLPTRRTLRETLIREAKYNFANRQIRLRANLFLVLRLNWPRYFNWLIKFHIGRRKCVICGELEDSKFVFCRNAACKVSYCNDCFDDIGNTCWICNDILSN